MNAAPVRHPSGLYYREWADDINVIGEFRDYKLMWQAATDDDVLLDVGAHIGVVTTRFARKVARVVAVEPDPDNLALLKRNTALFPNVTVVGAAVGLMTGNGVLYRNLGRGRCMHSLVAIRGRNAEPCRTISFQHLLTESVPTLLKMDIEGYEYTLAPVLAQLPGSVRMIATEFHITRQQWRLKDGPALHAAYVAQGFKAVKPPDFGRNAFGGATAVYQR